MHGIKLCASERPKPHEDMGMVPAKALGLLAWGWLRKEEALGCFWSISKEPSDALGLQEHLLKHSEHVKAPPAAALCVESPWNLDIRLIPKLGLQLQVSRVIRAEWSGLSQGQRKVFTLLKGRI